MVLTKEDPEDCCGKLDVDPGIAEFVIKPATCVDGCEGTAGKWSVG